MSYSCNKCLKDINLCVEEMVTNRDGNHYHIPCWEEIIGKNHIDIDDMLWKNRDLRNEALKSIRDKESRSISLLRSDLDTGNYKKSDSYYNKAFMKWVVEEQSFHFNQLNKKVLLELANTFKEFVMSSENDGKEFCIVTFDIHNGETEDNYFTNAR